MKPIKEKTAYGNAAGNTGASRSSYYSEGASASVLSSGKLGVDKSHCLPVIRALMAFMLHVDVTCNVDLFLISCKVSINIAFGTSVKRLRHDRIHVISEKKKKQRGIWIIFFICYAGYVLSSSNIEFGYRVE